MVKRVDEIDFLKCIFILLMISFHLVYIGDTYTYAKQVVYTFHIPAFFMISGYVMKLDKPIVDFMKTVLWLLVPYLIMESSYILMASFLPIREHISDLSFEVFLEKLLFKPIGPYWYLHSLIICSIVCYMSFIRYKDNAILVSRLVIASVTLGFISLYWNLISLSSILYFLLGVSIRQSYTEFLSFFKSSWLAIVGFAVLIMFPENLDRFTIGGLLITYLAVSSLLALYKILPRFLTVFFNYIGRHTLVLLLFSPIFTALVKPLVAYLSFEQTGMLFLLVALIINVAGCFGIGLLMDYIGISRFVFGKKKIMQSVK